MLSRICLALFLLHAVAAVAIAQQAPDRQPPKVAPESDDSPESAKAPHSGKATESRKGPETGQAPESGKVSESGAVPTLPAASRVWTSIEICLSVGILVFGFVVLLLEAYLIRNSPTPWSSTMVVRLVVVTIVITAVVLLVTAGYSNQQIAPVAGLLGSIVGYLLGSGKDGEVSAK